MIEEAFSNLSAANGAFLLLGAYVLYSLYFAGKSHYLSKKWNTKPAPKINGTTLSRLKEVYERAKTGEVLELNQHHFDSNRAHTFKHYFFGQTVYSTKNPDNIKFMLSKGFEDWNLGMRPSSFGPLLGNGIFVAEGEKWKQSRDMLKPQFSRKQISHVAILEPHLQNLVRIIKEYRSAPVDIQPFFHKFTMDSSTEFLFGESVSSLNFGFEEDTGIDFGRRKRFDESISYIQEYIMYRTYLSKFNWLLNSRKFRQNIKNVHEFTMDVINRAIAKEDKNPPSCYVFLYELLKVTRDPEVLRDETLNIMLAGRSTTASLLSSLFFELSRNPDVWAQLRREILDSFGSGSSQEALQEITFESLTRCTYLRYVINETLRMYPPVTQNVRKAVVDTTLPRGGGECGEDPVLVRKGDLVSFHMYAMHRSEEYYGPDAGVFRPDRWKDLAKIGSAFLPFGSGPRVCLGQKYALTEASYVVVRLAQIFTNLEYHGTSTYPPRKQNTATLQFKDGVVISMY